MAKAAGWAVKEGAAGWGSHAAMIAAMESALAGRAFILGDTFSMADLTFGGTLRYMLTFGMLEPRPIFTEYAERIGARPASKRADARNAAIWEERGIKMG